MTKKDENAIFNLIIIRLKVKRITYSVQTVSSCLVLTKGNFVKMFLEAACTGFCNVTGERL